MKQKKIVINLFYNYHKLLHQINNNANDSSAINNNAINYNASRTLKVLPPGSDFCLHGPSNK